MQNLDTLRVLAESSPSRIAQGGSYESTYGRTCSSAGGGALDSARRSAEENRGGRDVRSRPAERDVGGRSLRRDQAVRRHRGEVPQDGPRGNSDGVDPDGRGLSEDGQYGVAQDLRAGGSGIRGPERSRSPSRHEAWPQWTGPRNRHRHTSGL